MENLGAGLAALGVIGPGIGIGILAGMSASAIGRNPDAAGQIRCLAIILAAFIEGVALFAGHVELRAGRNLRTTTDGRFAADGLRAGRWRFRVTSGVHPELEVEAELRSGATVDVETTTCATWPEASSGATCSRLPSTGTPLMLVRNLPRSSSMNPMIDQSSSPFERASRSTITPPAPAP